MILNVSSILVLSAGFKSAADNWRPRSSFQAQTSIITDNHDMALSPGIYTIENVKHHNWAMLLDGNDEGEVVAGSSVTPNIGEKVGP
jgi:hypothetical protein